MWDSFWIAVFEVHKSYKSLNLKNPFTLNIFIWEDNYYHYLQNLCTAAFKHDILEKIKYCMFTSNIQPYISWLNRHKYK
jgi:hypothetical protein